MSDDQEVQLCKADVTVHELNEECEECGDNATHIVMIDFRSAGSTQALGRYCKDCAETRAGRIRDGLPA